MKKMQRSLLIMIGLIYTSSYAATEVLPGDPWYKGPKYNDVQDAQQFATKADALSKKVSGKALWIEPDDSRNFLDYHCVGAHNAHVQKRWFGTVYQHRHSTTHQLYYGVRGLMWDTYDGASFTKQGPGTIIMSHGKPGALAFTQKGNTTYQTLQYELRRVVEFMREHPQAVVTIILEDYVGGVPTAKEIKEVMAAAKYNPLFTPADYASTSGKSEGWPTLGWMRKNNKRLVIFSQNGYTSDVVFDQFTYCRENQYSTMDPNVLCDERKKSAQKKGTPTQKIIIFNNFSKLAVTHAARDIKIGVEYNNVKSIIERCKTKGWQPFNQYYADRIIDCCNELMEEGKKTVFQYANELNGK